MNTGRTRFKKGMTPWNKGKKTGPNPEHSERMMGKPAWNRGFEGYNAGKKHWTFGKKRPEITGENHWKWAGEKVGKSGVHAWIEKTLGKPGKCEFCLTIEAKRFEWANKTGKYLRNINDWIRLCSKCHHKYDDITNRGWETRRAIYV